LVFLSVIAIGALNRGNRSIEADRPERGGVAGTFAWEHRLSANQEEHHGRQAHEGQALVQYCCNRSQLPRQALPHCGGAHCTDFLVCGTEGRGRLRNPAPVGNRARLNNTAGIVSTPPCVDAAQQTYSK
jgi:hypothetical protein